jgi:KTSC domain
MVRVRSTAIAAIGYEPETQRMKITFQQGHTYDYCRVPSLVFEGLIRAASKGTYYNDHIKDRYLC